MLWYMMKTWPGGEETLAEEIRRTVPPYLYKEVFVIYLERIWRRQGRSRVQTEPLFAGSVFLTCGESGPLFRRLEQVPAVSRLMAAGYLSMFPLMERDAEFLEAISGNDHLVRTSFVLRERAGSETYRVLGPLEYLIDNIDRIKFSSRVAKTHKELWGENREIVIGIISGEDLGQRIWYGDLGVTVKPPHPDHYTILKIDKDEEGRNRYRAGRHAAAGWRAAALG